MTAQYLEPPNPPVQVSFSTF